MWFLLLWGCSCRDEPAPKPENLPHYAQFAALVEAAAFGDVEGGRVVARDLTEGLPVALEGRAGASEVGAALGYVQVADDGADLALGLARAAEGCGLCHGAESGGRPEIPWSHRAGAEALIGDLVWARPLRAPVGDDPAEIKLREALAGVSDTGEPDEKPIRDSRRVAKALEACQGCHVGRP